MISATPPPDLADDEHDAFAYLAKVAEGLADEASQRAAESPTLADVVLHARKFAEKCHAIRTAPGNIWGEFSVEYRHLVHSKANALNQLSSVSQPYATMEAFWTDVAAQRMGNSCHTFWDVYEHGRRRQLEALLSRAYGAQSALLVNSGMSAIAVALGMFPHHPRSKLLTGDRGYFETTEYIERILRPAGVEVIRTNVAVPGEVSRVLSELHPEMALFETVTNAPTADVLINSEHWFSASPSTIFVIDNSLQSHLTRWFDMLPQHSNHLIVVESAVKYLAHECMAGVLYGDAENVDRARDFARLTGQQLQEKAFNYICEGEIAHVGWRLRRHSQNTEAFLYTLRPYDSCFEFVCSPRKQGIRSQSATNVLNAGSGGLVFIGLNLPLGMVEEDKARLHREVLQLWQDRVSKSGLRLMVRAGFGWDETAARVYDSTRLNQPDAPTYLRVSVGIEPRGIVETLARELGEAACEVTKRLREVDNELGATGIRC